MLYFVFLRRPCNLSDRRDDPFWEFGSFGRTGCHHNNLMHPKRTRLLEGARLAFLQGGRGEIRLVGLTPPIKIMPTAEGIEARWDKSVLPYKFSEAPIFIDNTGHTDFPGVKSLFDKAPRTTWCGKAGSCLRSRTHAINEKLAASIIKIFGKWKGSPAASYLDTVAAESAAWHRAGISQGWAAKHIRESRFLNFGGMPPKVNGPVPTRCRSDLKMSASYARRKWRCC
ncbi:MAG: hypothetical protein ACYDB9_11735 [Gammaproteobacteria bacterium]